MVIIGLIIAVLLILYGIGSITLEKGTCNTFKDTIKSWTGELICIVIGIVLIIIGTINNVPTSTKVSINTDTWNNQKFDQIMHIEYTTNSYPWNTYGYLFDIGKHNILISKYDSVKK
jgi:branched-subunit amino acid permease